MQIFWTLKQIPELSTLERPERGIRWRKAYKLTFRHWQTWVGLALCGAFAGFGSYLGQSTGFRILGAGVGGGIGGFVFFQFTLAIARKHYRHILLGLDS